MQPNLNPAAERSKRLAMLSEWDIEDKHKVMIPVFVIPKNLELEMNTHIDNLPEAQNEPIYFPSGQILKAGEPVLRVRGYFNLTEAKVDIDISYGHPSMTRVELVNIVDEVAAIVESFS